MQKKAKISLKSPPSVVPDYKTMEHKYSHMCQYSKFTDLLPTASFDGTIKLWNINTLTCVSIESLLIYSLQPVLVELSNYGI